MVNTGGSTLSLELIIFEASKELDLTGKFFTRDTFFFFFFFFNLTNRMFIQVRAWSGCMKEVKFLLYLKLVALRQNLYGGSLTPSLSSRRAG